MTESFIDGFSSAVAYYNATWRVLDETLYRLCRENPRHDAKSAICAKLWIIGRTYATGIERKVATTGAQGSSMSQVADHFLAHATEIDTWFSELCVVAEPLTPSNLRTIVSIHGRLDHLLRPITRKSQSVRSFASKYMHFHNSAVPIFDSVAVGAMQGIVRWNKSLAVFGMPADADKEYGWYSMQFLALYEQAERAGLRPTVRHVDHYLLSLADSSYTGVVEPAAAGTE